jgi:hypothetical protein
MIEDFAWFVAGVASLASVQLLIWRWGERTGRWSKARPNIEVSIKGKALPFPKTPDPGRRGM